MPSGFALQHEIFVLDAFLKECLSFARHEDITNELIQELLDALRMEKLGDLQIYPAVDDRAPGWSFIQPITTSHISGHYFEKPGRYPNIRLDVYSCKRVNWQKVIRVVHDCLHLADWKATFITRGLDNEEDRTVMDLRGNGNTVVSQILIQGPKEEKILNEMQGKEIPAVVA